ncbi:hypothetical protein IGI37_003635 [Enterococcus sp. AZ194]
MKQVAVKVHFCNIFNTDDLFGMNNFLSVGLSQSKELVFKIEENAPFRKFIVVDYKKYFTNGKAVEISEQEFDEILKND